MGLRDKASAYKEIRDKSSFSIPLNSINFIFELFNRNINLAENLDEALTIFYRTVKDFFKINAANILIKNFSGRKFRTVKSLGLSEKTDKNFIIEKKEDTFNNIIELGESMFIPDFQEMKVFKKGIANEDKEKIKFFYCVPVKLGNKCFGFFNVFSSDNNIDKLSNDFVKALAYIPLGLLPYIINKSK